MWYKIQRESNTFTITNTGSNLLYVSLYVSSSCDIDENYNVVIPETVIAISDDYTFTLPTTDGLYKLILTDKMGHSQDIFIPQYSVLLESLVEDIDFALCGCHCSDCDDCDGDETDLMTVVLKLLAYNTINRGKYDKNLADTAKCVECEIFEISQCNLLKENVIGNVENTMLLKKLIAYYYLVYYNTDLRETLDITTTKSNYQYSKIYPCVKKILDNPECIPFNIKDEVDSECCERLEEELQSKLEVNNIIAGTNITLTTVGNNITINSSGGGAASIISTDYNSLKTLADSGNLQPGQLYVFDFTSIYQDRGSTITGSSIGSETYALIIKAVSTNQFEEDVTLLMPEFHYSSAWCKAKYSFLQNNPRFAWSRPDDMGQIYWMQDMYGNEADYDFIGISTTFVLTKLVSSNPSILPGEFWVPGYLGTSPSIGNGANIYGGYFPFPDRVTTISRKLYLFSDPSGNNNYHGTDKWGVKISTYWSEGSLRVLPQISFITDGGTIRNCILTQSEQAVFQTTASIENLNLFNVKRINIGNNVNVGNLKNIVADGKGIIRDLFVSGRFENVRLERIEKVYIKSSYERSTMDLKESYCGEIRKTEIAGVNVEVLGTIQRSVLKDINQFAVGNFVADVTIRRALNVNITNYIQQTMIDHFEQVFNIFNIQNMRAERILGFNGNGHSIENADFAPGCQYFQLLEDIKYYTVEVGNGGDLQSGWLGLYGSNMVIAPRTFENTNSSIAFDVISTLTFNTSMGVGKLVFKKATNGVIQVKEIGD